MYKSLALVGCVGSLFFVQGCSKPAPEPAAVASAPAASQPAPAAPAPSAPAPSAPASTAPARPSASGPTGIAGGNSSASDGGQEPANTPPAPARSRPTAAGPGITASSGGAPAAGTGRPSAAGPGINPSAGAGPGAPASPAAAGGPAGLLGNLGNAFASAPPVQEKLTLKDRAVAAFQMGNTARAYKLLEAYALHVTDEEALEILKDYRWSSATKKPQLGLNMAVGVTLKNPKNAPAISPLGSEPASVSGGAAGGSSFSRGSGTQSGAKPAGITASGVTSLAQATGVFSSSFIEEFRKKHDEGAWTVAFKEYSLGTPSRGISGAGSSMVGFGGGSTFGGSTPGATDGPPAGYAGGGTSQPPMAAGGPPAGYNGGGGGMQPGYGGTSGPPAGYNGGGGGMQPGYGGSNGPPAGYNGGGGGMQPGYGGSNGPPAGYNGGGGGMRPGAGSPSGPPAGYNGGGGGMQPGSPSGGSGAPLQFRRRQGSGLDDGGGPPPPNTPINAVGPGRPGTGLGGGAGPLGGDMLSMGPDATLPRGHVPLAPCLTYIGADEANKLIKKAVEDGFDGLFIFEIELDVNRVVGKVINDTRIRVLLPKENVKETKAIFSCKRLNNIQASKSVAKGESDGVTDAVELTVKKTEEGFALQSIPAALTPEIISTKRIPSLIADKSGSVIDRLSEVNFYYSQGMIDDKQKADAFEGIAGEQGTAIVSGTPEDKLEAVEKLLERELR